MKFYLLAAAAAVAISSPAAARDGAGYIGLEGGLILDADTTVDARVDDGDEVFEFDDAFNLDFEIGTDVDLIAGYDLGMIRAEIELGHKRTKVNEVEFNDDITDDEDQDFDDLADLEGRATVMSIMGNVLFDAVNLDTTSFYVGGGIGQARVKMFGERDTALAFQGIVGGRSALTDNIDVGLKYRYFRTANLNYSETISDELLGDFDVDYRGRFQTHSLLLSLIFNLGAPAAPIVEAPLPPPPPPAAPATQTCPDGSVILATDVCPVPPPPPPPPPAGGERG